MKILEGIDDPRPRKETRLRGAKRPIPGKKVARRGKIRGFGPHIQREKVLFPEIRPPGLSGARYFLGRKTWRNVPPSGQKGRLWGSKIHLRTVGTMISRGFPAFRAKLSELTAGARSRESEAGRTLSTQCHPYPVRAGYLIISHRAI